LPERVLHWLLLVAAMLAIVAVVWRSRVAEPADSALEGADPVLAVPPGPGLLISADVSELSRAAQAELLSAFGDKLLGLRETCGFEPLLSVKRVAFAMPFQARAQHAASDFALIAETSLKEEQLSRCAQGVIRKRGGVPVRLRIGQFLSVRDSAKPLGEVAMRFDGLFVLSGGQYFRDVVDVAGGLTQPDEAARARSAVHGELRRKLGPAPLLATLLPGASFSTTGVRAVGLALQIESELRLRGFVGCESVAACSEAKLLLERMKADPAEEPALALLRSVVVKQHDAQLEVSARWPRSELRGLLHQLLEAP